MLVHKSSENTVATDAAKYNERSFSTLMRALRLSQGYSSFVLVNCNSLAWRQEILDRLEATCPEKPWQLLLPKSATTLYRTIAAAVDGEQPPALMILGLESVESIDRLLISTNLVCSEFSKKFSFPVVFWVTDELLRKIIRTAPDLYSRMTTIRFISQ